MAKKPKGNKPQKPRARPQPKPPSLTAPPPAPLLAAAAPVATWWSRTWSLVFRWWKTALALLGLVASAVAIYLFFWAPLELRFQPIETSEPFSVHFSARNTSYVLTYEDVKFSCALGNVESSTGIIVQDIEIADGSKAVDIEPGQTVQFVCSFHQAFGFVQPDEIESAAFEGVLRYRTSWFGRLVRQTFTWDKRHRVWSDGQSSTEAAKRRR